MLTAQIDIEAHFRSILPPDSVRRATDADAVSGIPASLVLEPPTELQLAAALRHANDANLAVIPRGGGTKLSWGNPPTRADVVLSTARLNKIIEHVWSDLTVTVEAGCTVQNLQQALAQHGQRLALDPLWPEQATIGGVLSTNDSGALRLRFGALRDLIIGVTIALPDGTLASSGGKVVKNVAGYDLPKLITGALGTLGVITRAVFRLHPLPRNSTTLSVSGCTLEETQRLLLAIQDSKLAHTSLQARFADDSEASVDILFEGTEAGIAAQESQLQALAGPSSIREVPHTAWNTSEDLWSSRTPSALVKFSVLPANISKAIQNIKLGTNSSQLEWWSIVQATGIGWLRLDGDPQNVHAALVQLRAAFERDSASLVLLRRPPQLPPFDAWGAPGDSLALMRAVKHQFDPKNTLNPGRFLAGI